MSESTQEESSIKLINKSKKQNNFLVIDNFGYIRDRRLSLKAKGVLTLLLTNNPNWEIHLNETVRHSRDGLSALSSAFKELIAFKYMYKEVERDEKGHFTGTIYYIYDEPYDGSKIVLSEKTEVEKAKMSNPEQDTPKVDKAETENLEIETPEMDKPITDNPEIENPEMDNPEISKPVSDNPNSKKKALTKTNSTLKESKQTYCDDVEENDQETVCESEFHTIIRKLFDGDYPFDQNFEEDVLLHLEAYKIKAENLDGYLHYVFDRAEMQEVKKTFEGLYRSLALSNSIARDFKHSKLFKKCAVKDKPVIEYITCPICSNQIQKYGDGCPFCGTEMRVLKNTDLLEFDVAKKIWSMTDDEKEDYYDALSEFEADIKKKNKREFITPEDYRQFWQSYGIISPQPKLYKITEGDFI